MDKEFIKTALDDSDKIHMIISDTNNALKANSKTLKNVSMTLKIENNRIQDKNGVATGIAPLAQEIERVSKDINNSISDLINHHRPRLYECNEVMDFIIGCVIENEKIVITDLIDILKEKADSGQSIITNLELNHLAIKAGKFDPHRVLDNADKYMGK